MNITPESMEAMILRNMDLNQDPHLKKLLTELKAIKEELEGPKTKQKQTFKQNPDRNSLPDTIKKEKKKRRQTEGDATFRASINIPLIQRKSDRLSGKTPKYEYMDDIDDVENRTLYHNGQLRMNNVVKPRVSFHRNQSYQRTILTPEEVTEEMLNNISYKLTDKVYDHINGSSCHQCRQKTSDTKTICRNLECVGVRGQFCGPCAQNRYGVDVAVALMDPYWSCFVCQGVCNCSFCRSRKGKRPTGILVHIAKREGHDSVKEFLDNLKLKISEEDDEWERNNDPESVFGFESDDIVLTGNGKEELVDARHSSLIESVLLRDFVDDFGYKFWDSTPILSINQMMLQNGLIIF
ncbi:hypothetical protein HHI36_016193 [Cryptolaemus montrouzieri]|uniref:Zinc-finger domain-containing protein n=1 Tax=Cryptolaemus montrouzieri TaxID=559131 RepID=A0ABD2NIS8_9CUCU